MKFKKLKLYKETKKTTITKKKNKRREEEKQLQAGVELGTF